MFSLSIFYQFIDSLKACMLIFVNRGPYFIFIFMSLIDFHTDFLILKHLNFFGLGLNKRSFYFLIFLNFYWPLCFMNILSSWNYWHIFLTSSSQKTILIFRFVCCNKTFICGAISRFTARLLFHFSQSFLNLYKSLHITIILLSSNSFTVFL